MKIKESKKKGKYPDLARELKTMQPEGNGDAHCIWCTWNNPQRIGKGTGTLGNKRINRDHPDYSIIKIGQNTEKSPGDLLSLKFQWETISLCWYEKLSKE